MANEITVTAMLGCVSGAINEVDADAVFTIDQSVSSGSYPGFCTIATTEESETFSEITTLGWCKIKNLDATNFVDFGFTTAVYGIRLKPNEMAVFRLVPGVTMFMKADTSAVKVQIRCYDN